MSKIFQQCCQNSILRVHRGRSNENNVFPKKNIFYLNVKLSAYCRQFISSEDEFGSYVSIGTFWRQMFPPRKLSFSNLFRRLSQNFWAISPQIFCGRCQMFNLRCINILKKNIFSEKMIVFFYFPNSFKKIAFRWIFFGPVVQTPIHVSGGTVYRKTFFFSTFVCHFCTMSDFFVLFPEKFQRGCLNCILRVRSFLKKKSFLDIQRFFLPSLEKASAVLSELFSMRP